LASPLEGGWTGILDAALALLQVGLAMPRRSPGGRCALTAPFHPYPFGRYVLCGAVRRPGIWPRPPGLWPSAL